MNALILQWNVTLLECTSDVPCASVLVVEAAGSRAEPLLIFALCSELAIRTPAIIDQKN